MNLVGVLNYGLWAATVTLQAAVAILLFRRRLYRSNWAFFSYTVFEIVRQVLLASLLSLYKHNACPYSLYFYVYWLSDLVSIALSLVIIRAVIRSVFREHPMLRRFSSYAFGIAVLVLLAAAILTMSTSPGGSSERLLSAILLLDRSIRLIQIGLILLLTAIAAILGLPWKADVAFGIALGFGIFASLDLASVSMRTQLGQSANAIFGFVRPVAYALAVLTWFLYSRVPQGNLISDVPQNIRATEVEDWNETLAEMLGQ